MCSCLIFSFPTFYSVMGVGLTLDSACSVWALVSVSVGGSWGSLVGVGVGVDRSLG